MNTEDIYDFGKVFVLGSTLTVIMRKKMLKQQITAMKTLSVIII